MFVLLHVLMLKCLRKKRIHYYCFNILLKHLALLREKASQTCCYSKDCHHSAIRTLVRLSNKLWLAVKVPVHSTFKKLNVTDVKPLYL